MARFFITAIAVFCIVFVQAQTVEEQLGTMRKMIYRGIYDNALLTGNALIEILQLKSPRDSVQLFHAYKLRGICWYETGRPEPAIRDFKEAGRWRNGHKNGADAIRADLDFFIGSAFGIQPNPDSCVFYLNRSLAARTWLYGAESPPAAFCYNALGGHYAGQFNFDEALRCRQRALVIFEKYRLWRHAVAVSNNLAMLYNSLGDPGRAVLYYRKALMNVPYAEINLYDQANILSNYAVLLAGFGKYAAADSLMDKAWEMYASEKDNALWVELAENAAACHRLSGRYDQALVVDSIRYDMVKARSKGDLAVMAGIKSDLARDLFLLERYAGSLNAWNEVIAVMDTNALPSANALREAGICLRVMGNAALASSYLERSLIVNGFRSAGVQGIYQLEIGFQSFYELAKLHFENGYGEKAVLELLRADSCLVLLRRRIRAAESKLRLSSLGRSAYELGVEACGNLYARTGEKRWFDAAFYFSEQSKGVLLAESIRAFDPAFVAGVPYSIRRLEDSLRAEIAQIRDRSSRGSGSDGDHRQEFVLTERYNHLLDTCKSNYPGYFNLRYGRPPIPTDSLSAWCRRRNKPMASYFLTDKTVFVFVFRGTAQSDTLLSIPRDFPLDSTVLDLLAGITAYQFDSVKTRTLSKSALRRYGNAADLLNRKILAPVRQQLPTSASRLILIPDGLLTWVPFDALLIDAPPASEHDFAAYRFVAEEMNITYGFSASVVYDLSGQRDFTRPLHPMLIYAPFAFPRDTFLELDEGFKFTTDVAYLDALPETVAEAKLAAENMGGRVFSDTLARLDSFLRYGPEADALLLTTHGWFNSSDPDSIWLFFSGPHRGAPYERLYATQLVNRRLKAGLVVVSSCESGRGPYAPGEGVLSIGRAFVCAGVPNVVMTLWPVRSKPSANLSAAFYRGISEQQLLPADALWHAKKKMTDRRLDFERMPFYWAGFVLVGSD